MDVIHQSTLLVLAAGLTGIGAVLASRIATTVRLPAPAVFLVSGAVISTFWPEVRGHLPDDLVARVGTFALVVLLFEGGMRGGWARTRAVAGPILLLGVPGTLLTAGMLAAACHWLLGLQWGVATLVAIALAPTDPAATFSVLGSKSLRGDAPVLLEGESGANDPVGIALMLGAIEFLQHQGSMADVTRSFCLELVFGLVGGIAGGLLIAAMLRRARLGDPTLHAMLGLASAMTLYGIVAGVDGSGFLAVFIAGMFVGDGRPAERRATFTVLAFGATAAEILMFTMLGLRVDVHGISPHDLAISAGAFVILTFVVRPLVVMPLLEPTRIDRPTAALVAWGGLKGAVPILLAAFTSFAAVDGSATTEEIVFVVVAASILIQGGTLNLVADRLGMIDVDVDDDAGGGSASASATTA